MICTKQGEEKEARTEEEEETWSKEGIRRIKEDYVLDFLSCTSSVRGKSAVKCRLEQN